MPNLSHEEFHEKEEGQEDEEKKIPNSYYWTAKTFFKTLNQTRIGDIAMAPEIFVDEVPGHADYVHHHSVHSDKAKPQLPPEVVARFVTGHRVQHRDQSRHRCCSHLLSLSKDSGLQDPENSDHTSEREGKQREHRVRT